MDVSVPRASLALFVLAGCAAAPLPPPATAASHDAIARTCIPAPAPSIAALGLVPSSASSDASPELAALALSRTVPGVRTVLAGGARFVAYAVSDLATQDHVAVVRIEGEHRVPPTKDAVFRVRLEAAHEGAMLDVIGLALSDFDGDRDDDLLLDVRVTTDEVPGSTHFEDVLVVLDSSSLATLFEATVDVSAADPESLACTTTLARTDSDCDGITDVVVADTLCHQPMCEGRGPTDPVSFRACLSAPAPRHARYVRDSTGAFLIGP